MQLNDCIFLIWSYKTLVLCKENSLNDLKLNLQSIEYTNLLENM